MNDNDGRGALPGRKRRFALLRGERMLRAAIFLFALAYALALSLLVTGPLLGPGYLLLRDAVSTPRSYLSDAALGLTEAAPGLKVDTHGAAISHEFIAEANPDWLFVVDRGVAVGEAGSHGEEHQGDDIDDGGDSHAFSFRFKAA